MTVVEHPDITLEHLLATRSLVEARQTTLRAVHEVCQARFSNGKRSFLRSEVGEELEKAGLLTQQSFKQPHCNVYAELAMAWHMYSIADEFSIPADLPADHPHSVLLRLSAMPGRRAATARSLRALHRACLDRFERGEQHFGAAELAREVPKGALASKALTHFVPEGLDELLAAWQRHAEQAGGAATTGLPAEHPDAVFARHRKAPNLRIDAAEILEAFHRACQARFERGEIDFTSVSVGHELVKEGVFSEHRSTVNRLNTLPRYTELLAAWQRHADETWIDFAPDLSPRNPHSVYRRLKASLFRSDRLRVLLGAHRVCYEQHAAGETDFTLNTIGKLLAERGVTADRHVKRHSRTELHTLISSWSLHARPWLEKGGAPPPLRPSVTKANDVDLDWVRRDYPQFEPWREPASEWLKTTNAGLSSRLAMLAPFFQDYLTLPDAPATPADLFARGSSFPDPGTTVTAKLKKGQAARSNLLRDLFQWTLLRDFSLEADDGELIVSTAFYNPLERQSKKTGESAPSQSVRSTLPFDFIHELRHILAEGKDFRDWKFAQNALGVSLGSKGAPSNDWYTVDPGVMDRSDPDCVWRKRERKRGRKTVVDYQMWSPVRWVAVHTKLLLPLRTFQVRMLDSGESDTWKYEGGAWKLNDHPLASPEAQPWRQGVLCRSIGIDEAETTVLYANTNKTADLAVSGPNKGYEIPWYVAGDVVENVFYWLEKLRNWQAKYNPIRRRTSWSELEGRHMGTKSAAQLASYPDTCFLFRMAQDSDEERMLPVTDSVVSSAWFALLEEYQTRLATRNECHPGGRPIVLVTREDGRTSSKFPLHSLRVSLITALALDGEVPFPILQKLVGHSRLIMTLYYTKPGNARIADVLAQAAVKLDAKREASLHAFLLDTEHEALLQQAVCNSQSTLRTVIPIHPAERNAAGWMHMHHGLCLVGGNVSEIGDSPTIGGCHNGGEADERGRFQPVPGGPRNCVRCRWFVTEPHYLQQLVDHFNHTAYHFDEARNDALESHKRLQGAKRAKAEAEAQGELDTEKLRSAVVQADRVRGTKYQRFSDLVEDLVACWRLIERCRDVLMAGQGEGRQLVLQGAATDVEFVFEETESELLQLCGVCDSVELYPDLDPGKAVLRRSQLLDAQLLRDGLPPMFLALSAEEQLKVGNAVMQRLAAAVSPDSPLVGRRKVVELIDAGARLGDSLGIKLVDALPSAPARPLFPLRATVKPVDEAIDA